ncbi:Nucleotide exchange factor SIL1 [Pteropus alecto]|uniref:Nucleotide exchange factor SIL1 n=1 Tax=Pteropus alecto TaxID=9402 RepID=L5JX23_PTEAL|nr:Nucleotide exchange factor SIL1 [Pteropus alecto]
MSKWALRSSVVSGDLAPQPNSRFSYLSHSASLVTLLKFREMRQCLPVPPEGLPLSRMAPHGMLLGLLMASCFIFCLSHQNPEFALTYPERSSTKETERKETTAEEELDPEVLNVFHPTHEWQALRPGQAVPAGSHVRLNLQTGTREVKLQDEDKFQNTLKGSKKGKRLDINTNTYTSQDLKSALAKFKEGTEMESSKEDKARHAEIKRLFRPIEELKKDFEELNVVIETDMQIMVRLINKFNSSSSSLEEKIAALFDLEYYVHQMDNAQDLLSFGGLQVVINGLNSTEPLLKEYAAFVLGAAFSSHWLWPLRHSTSLDLTYQSQTVSQEAQGNLCLCIPWKGGKSEFVNGSCDFRPGEVLDLILVRL